jgi:hypothetical protein
MQSPEPTSVGRRDLEPRDTWQYRSPPQQGGEVRSRGTHGSAEAHIGREARSRAVGHMAAPEPILTGRRGLKLMDTWQLVDVHIAPCFDLKLVWGYHRYR